MSDMVFNRTKRQIRLRIERMERLKLIKVPDLQGEYWVAIPGFEGHYEISNYARVKSLFREVLTKGGIPIIKNEMLRKTSINDDGYECIIIVKDRVKKNTSVHILMAITFLGNVSWNAEVNHIDGDKLNNLATNLEFITRKGNMAHSVKNGLRKYKKGENTGRYKIPQTEVMKIYNSEGNTGDLAKLYGVTKSAIQRIRSGKTYKTITNHGLDTK